MIRIIRISLSTAARQSPYERDMDSLIASSSSANLARQRRQPGSISIANLNLSLGQGAARVHILKDISLNVASGEAVGLVGASGSGKSTLLMVTAGLERPDSGEVVVNGTSFKSLGEDDLARFRGRHVGIVFQSFHLIPTMTALENVAVPLELAGHADATERAAHELKSVGLGERLGHYPTQLSGGEQQRVAIARALAPQPAILLADEPTGNLDETTGRQIIELLFANHATRAMTLVLVTHDTSLAARCDRVIRLRSGRIDVPARMQSVDTPA
jgi:putative ABC transport system ATP-binding protein